ncbi:MAG TPA: phosphoglucomutase (alpha-D-glucose-1,6-bisphosphate-dependent) [Rhizomicrobium sp.]|nr:phosphoglucomutase (alpha-D-glucose-1,6-bisphosphate-dependent) [Rhizomicrobium sp.]
MSEKIDPRAGEMPKPSDLVDLEKLDHAYYANKPDPSVASQRVSFGTSGHRGSAFDTAFNEDHILAITQAICDHRKSRHIDGPLFLGRDTHALSEPAFKTALEVLAANDVSVMIDAQNGYTPTPAISHAILVHNRNRTSGRADGIVITPSHNPPSDGGFKYNPPHGGPAESEITGAIERAANTYLKEKLDGVRRSNKTDGIARHDYISNYVADLANVVDMEAIRASGLRIGIDPLGGAAVHYWQPIIDRYKIDATVVNATVDPTFRFMPLDWDGKIRMDCSSPYAMKKLLAIKDKFDLSFGNDTDADRHGIVCKSGLMPPNNYLAVSIDYLKQRRENWPRAAGIGKTLVSSSMIDRVAKRHNANLVEVPVGFKWFVGGLLDASLCFGGEESAGSSFLRRDGTVWTTDKDGLIAGLLAAEITARTGQDPAENYRRLAADLGQTFYARIDSPANAAQKAALSKLDPSAIRHTELAGAKIERMLSKAPGNGQPFGGLKVETAKGWFAARPSGTEDVYKVYAESFESEAHLARIQKEAGEMLADVLNSKPA